MDQVHVIRHKVLVEGVSIRVVSREMGVSRNTVRKYLRESEPVRKCLISRGCSAIIRTPHRRQLEFPIA